ncbi:50S ribosomal protein L9 [uncultured spirochete]|jgi:large subunit ribosomal protein L9|uniref:Large ribosomal subunit protein bL9 n=1 Tax=uncultured spirochete TaxID=156406 RepID=A0A3P3XG85_9SPIR|nr:50S ribosomal protein L9 [Rectinema subterraneum]SLM10008.1 50S ribosomal protein L9 [uncultured spirochete]HBE46673.1 50S ribosomal protein L9 [Spirochaetaceae bacterium]HCX95407.1 50S ribosomal protein L9 [Spirochaetaceae bacterium]
MKVILNQDIPNLGEIGDIKEVAAGYARNYLLPKKLVMVYNEKSAAMLQKRQAEILAIKEQKRLASRSLKEKLEADTLVISMPAGSNGKLYGAVTNHTIADELLKKGIEVDRKKIEVPGRSIKSVGNYKVAVKLYEKDEAALRVSIEAQAVASAEEKKAGEGEAKKHRPRRQRTETEPATAEEQAAAFEAAVNRGQLS